MTGIDWLIVGAYMAASLWIGFSLTRRASSSLSEFFLSGRNLPWWLAGTSMVATTFSADTPLYVTGLVRQHGIYENWQWWALLLSGMLAVFVFARYWRRAGVMTDVELIELRYGGRPAAVLRGFKAVYFAFFIHTIIKAQVILAMVKILDVAVGWGKWEVIAVASIVTIAYALASGYWGVVWTDFFQIIVAMAGAVLLAVYAVDAAGGLVTLPARIADSGRAEALSFLPPAGLDFWSPAVIAFAGYLGLVWWSRYSVDGGGVIVQRMASCRTEKDALAATFFFNITHYAVRTWPWILAALASLVLYPSITDHERVYAVMMMDLLPTGVRGLMLASLLAAFMSTLSSYLNLSSAYFVNDFYKRFIRPHASERHHVLAARLSMLGLSVITGIVTYQVESIVGVFKFLLAFGSGTGLVMLLRWFWWRVNAWTEIAAIAVSMGLSFLAYLVPPFIAWSYSSKLVLIIAGSALAAFIVTLATSPVPLDRLREFYRLVQPPALGWRPVSGPQGGDGGLFVRDVTHWAYGVTLVLGATIGPGLLLLGRLSEGAGILLVSGLAGFLLARSVGRRGWV